jgi:hypothetical protein
MRRIYAILLLTSFIGLGSCGLISDLIPDVDTTFSKVFPIDIGDPQGKEGPLLVDLTDSEDYKDFEGNIDGFEVNDVKFEIFNYKAPADMYFSGVVEAVHDGKSVDAGTIERFLLSSVADDGNEYPVTKVVEGLDQIVDWLDSPGKFDLYVKYSLTDEVGDAYKTEGMGYRFDIRITYYVTVKTGV